MSELLSIAIGLTLLVAGGQKVVAGYRQFEDVVRRFALLPSFAVGPVARLLPAAELVLGGALIVGIGSPLVAAVAAGLFSAFSLAVSVNLLRGRRDISCGCFGASSRHRLSWGIAGRGLLLALASVLAASWPSTDPLLGRNSLSASAWRVGGMGLLGTSTAIVLLLRQARGLRRLQAGPANASAHEAT